MTKDIVMPENNQIDIKIVAEIQRFIEDVNTKETFSQIIGDIERQLERTSRSFTRNLKGNPDWILAKCDNEIQDVYDHLDVYFELIDETKKYTENENLEKLAELKGEFKTITNAINFKFTDLKNRLLIAWGPFEHPEINLLIALVSKAKAIGITIKEIPQETLPLSIFADKYFEEIQKMENSSFKNALINWQQSYIELLKDANEIKPEQLDGFMERLHILGNKHYAMNLANTAGDYEPETGTLVIANIIKESAELYMKEYLSSEMFSDILSFLDASLEQINSLVPVQTAFEETEVANESNEENIIHNTNFDTSAILSALSTMSVAVSGYYDCIQNNILDISEYNALLMKGLQELKDAMEHLKFLGEIEGKIPCMRCGNYSEGSLRFCSKCNAPLMSLIVEKNTTIEVTDGDFESSGPVMTTNIENLFNAAQYYYEGELTKSDYLAEIEKFEKLISKAKQVPSEGDGSEDKILKKADVNYKRAINKITEGKDILKKLSDNLDLTLLNTGKDLIWNGVTQLQQMQKDLRPYIEQK